MDANIIPKIIHYCWFGKNPLPDEAKRCIESWKRYFPDYEIIEWNETNYDINVCAYVREAYEKKKWAFVSDYARFDILYKQGGIYFDTDVEVIKSMEDIIEKGSFMGLERGDFHIFENTSAGYVHGSISEIAVAPGLGLASVSGLQLYKEILEGYNRRHFIKSDGDIDTSTVCHFVTEILMKNGITVKDGVGYSSGVIIYPVDFFCPKNPKTGLLTITENTRSVHLYSATWTTPLQQKIHDIEKEYINKYGEIEGIKRSKKATFLYRILNKIQSKGILGSFDYAIKKFVNNNCS